MTAYLRYGRADNPTTLLYSVSTLLWITFFCQCASRSLPQPRLEGRTSLHAIACAHSPSQPLFPQPPPPERSPRTAHRYWRRQEARLAYRWGTEDFAGEERERREFTRSTQAMSAGFYTPEGWFIRKRELKSFLRQQSMSAALQASVPSSTGSSGLPGLCGGGSSKVLGGAGAGAPSVPTKLVAEECPLKREDVAAFVENHNWTLVKTFQVEQRWPLQMLSCAPLPLAT